LPRFSFKFPAGSISAVIAKGVRDSIILVASASNASIDWQHTVRGVNVVGLKRAGFDERRIREIWQVYHVLFGKGRNLSLTMKEIEDRGRAGDDVSALLEFIKSSKRGVCFGD